MPTVFPSSTSRDLRACRAAVLEACRALFWKKYDAGEFKQYKPQIGGGARRRLQKKFAFTRKAPLANKPVAVGV